MIPQDPFDPQEARRLIYEAKAIEEELTDLPGWGRRVDEAYMLARIERDREAQDRAGEESQWLARLCSRRALMWEGMAAGLDAQEISVVRTSAQAIRQCAEDAFKRSWDDGEGGGAQRFE
jgi:hypothetical protein